MDKAMRPSPMALAIAVWNNAKAWTRDRIFFGAFVKAYSSEVMDAKISEMAMRT